MAAYILSPERWRELSAASSPVAVADGQQQTPQAVGPGIRRRISRVFYEAHHTPGNIKIKSSSFFCTVFLCLFILFVRLWWWTGGGTCVLGHFARSNPVCAHNIMVVAQKVSNKLNRESKI